MCFPWPSKNIRCKKKPLFKKSRANIWGIVTRFYTVGQASSYVLMTCWVPEKFSFRKGLCTEHSTNRQCIWISRPKKACRRNFLWFSWRLWVPNYIWMAYREQMQIGSNLSNRRETQFKWNCIMVLRMFSESGEQ